MHNAAVSFFPIGQETSVKQKQYQWWLHYLVEIPAWCPPIRFVHRWVDNLCWPTHLVHPIHYRLQWWWIRWRTRYCYQFLFWRQKVGVCKHLESNRHFKVAIIIIIMNHSRISSDRRVCDCRPGGCLLDSLGQTNTQGLNITEKCRYCLYPATG